MHRPLLELVSELVEGAHYREAERIVQSLHEELGRADGRLGKPAYDRLVELLQACTTQHARVERHWEAAASMAATETRLRSQLILLLTDAVTPVTGPSEPAVGSSLRTPGTAPSSDPEGCPPPSEAVVPGRSDLAVHCLGPLRVYRDDRDLGPPPNRRARSVFKYLLVHRGRPTPKDVLMGLFWPEATPTAARNSLNVAIHGLRRYLRTAEQDGHVLFRGDGYQFHPDLRLWIDLEEFTTHAERAAALRLDRNEPDELVELEDAEVLCQGALFEDDPYEDWAADHVRTVHDTYVEVLDRLCERYRLACDRGGMARVLRKVLTVQPAHEAAHRELMRCFAGAGQRHLALRQYDDCRTALDRHLDLEPSRETTLLYERIRLHEPSDQLT